MISPVPVPRARLTDAVSGRHAPPAHGFRIGLLPGEGVGPELTEAAGVVLAALEQAGGTALQLLEGPSGGESSKAGSLTDAGADFCRDMFASGGAVLAGPHGGRWVYELRAHFDLFCKLSPLSARLAVRAGAPVPFDILVVREQSGGVYQGRWGETDARQEGHIAEHSFSYSRREVARIIRVGIALASARDGRLALIVKDGGVPSISRLWRLVGEELSEAAPDISLEVLDVDFAAYRLVQDPGSFGVLVTPNLFGDILSDLGGVLLGSRGMCFGASFDAGRAAVFQTNHGAAWDLAGTGQANPTAHLLSAAMLLRESFALEREAAAIEWAVMQTLRAGTASADLGGGSDLDAIVEDVCGRLPQALASAAPPARR